MGGHTSVLSPIGVRKRLLHPVDLGDVGDLVVSEDSALVKALPAKGVGGKKVVDCGAIDLSVVPADFLSGLRCLHIDETNNAAFLQQALTTITAAVAALYPPAPTCDPAALFAAAVAKEHFNPHDPSYV